MKNKDVLVQKASGEAEPYSIQKLRNSLFNSGANHDEVEQITDEITNWIFNGITTREIYSRAYNLLQQKRNHLASRYKLKKAIMELGPTGFPFEHFVAKIFDSMGFSTETGQIMNGYCITHEIDVIAKKENEEHLVECKYGQSPGKTVSVQVPLYVRSRVDDIFKKQKVSDEYNKFSFHGWVVTNTRFTLDAISYGKCCGLQLLSWDYPPGKGMKDIIDKDKIYPITVLTQLTQKQKQYLLEHHIVACPQIISEPELLNPLHLETSQYNRLIKELNEIT
jgi:hypothetical protein